MADNGAPVCNLPNVGQEPALQPGRLYPSIPKATDLPSLVQAVNTMSQIVLQLTTPGLPPFKNNLAPFTRKNIAGTPGIVGAAGADGSAARSGKDGKDGKKAKDPKWKQGDQKSEKVKVKGTEDNEDAYLIMRRVTHLTMTSSVDGEKKIEWQGTVGGAFGGPIEMGQPLPSGTDFAGRDFKGTDKFDRETTEENSAFPSRSTNGSGMPSNPFQPGLMADCVGVEWGGGLAVEFFE